MTSEPRCPDCHGLDLSYRAEHKLWHEPVCCPATCKRWKLVAKANDGPLLQLVEGAR